MLVDVIKKQFKPQGTKEKTIALGSIVPSLNVVRTFSLENVIFLLALWTAILFFGMKPNPPKSFYLG